MIGQMLGGYRVLQELGEGGLGTLYAAQHQNGTNVALRALSREFCGFQELMRCHQIADAAAKLGHPGIQGVYEYFQDNRGGAYLVSELITGESLAHCLRRDHRFYPEIIIKVAWQIATAVGTAHEAGILHGLLRPENIFVIPDPQHGHRIKVCDFGITAFFPEQAPAWGERRTLHGMGMPFYLAPEVCQSGRRDHRADVYALGCLMFHMACGRPPFLSQSAFDLANAQVHMPQKRAGEIEPSLPPGLDAVIWQATHKEPGLRTPSMRELATALERLAMPGVSADPTAVKTVMLNVDVRGPRRRVRAVHFVAFAIVAAGVGGGLALMRTRKPPPPVVQPTPPPPAVLVPPIVDVPGPTPLQKEIIAAVDALEAERWDDATAATRRALALDPKNAEAQRLARWAKLGPKQQPAYREFLRAVAKKDRAAARRRLARIPEDGPYHARAKTQLELLPP